ncbi:MAG: CHASE3 domain-containing protein [Gammaproteobacteria bacterium]|nr:CHASE3 domain-containing protein [Gammaproteobacteria bacterium]
MNSFTQLSTERKVFITFALMFCVLMLLGATAIVTSRRFLSTTDMVSHTYAVIARIKAVRAALDQTESAQRAFIITGDDAFLLPQDASLSDLDTALADLRDLTSDNPVQQRRLDRLGGLVAEWRARLSDMQLLRQQQGFAAAAAQVRLRTLADVSAAISGVLDAMRGEEQRLLAGRLGREKIRSRVMFSIYGLIGVAALGFMVAIYPRIRTEIVRRREAQAALAAANAELEAKAGQLESANKELESFSYSVSHDLRSPLRAIAGYGRMLEEDHSGTLDQEGLRLLGVIRKNADRMGGLIDDLLAFSRLGRKSLELTLVDMAGLAARAREELNTAEPGSTRQFDIDPLPPVPGDTALLQQVWINLLSNAVKYSSRTAQPRISVSSHDDGEERVYCVRDNGAGFDMRYYHKLFGVFQRLHAQDQFPGTGIGLAIVHRIITRHGGRVWAESVPGEGASFYFALPRGEQS